VLLATSCSPWPAAAPEAHDTRSSSAARQWPHGSAAGALRTRASELRCCLYCAVRPAVVVFAARRRDTLRRNRAKPSNSLPIAPRAALATLQRASQRSQRESARAPSLCACRLAVAVIGFQARWWRRRASRRAGPAALLCSCGSSGAAAAVQLQQLTVSAPRACRLAVAVIGVQARWWRRRASRTWRAGPAALLCSCSSSGAAVAVQLQRLTVSARASGRSLSQRYRAAGQPDCCVAWLARRV
jgi:hypothetical protein